MNQKKKMAMKDYENNEDSKDKNGSKKKKKDGKKSKRSNEVNENRELYGEQNRKGQSWGSENPPVSGPGNRTTKMNKRRNWKSESEDSEDNFLSSLNININHLLGLAGVVAGGALLYKVIKGDRPFNKKSSEIDINTKQTIKKSREELYSYWRNLENLPNFMSHLEEVEEIDNRRSRWTAEIPGGLGTIEWEARITEEEENEYLSWKSLPNSEIKNSGEVTFKDAPNGEGTIVEATISYHPPAGKAGDYAAKIFNPAFEKTVKKDLKQFKKHMEESRKSKSDKNLY